MSSPNIIGNTPVWNYGKNASFGLWVNPLKDSKLFVALYKGVVFNRKTTFLWTAIADETPAVPPETAPEHEVTLSFKQKMKPEIVVVPASGAVIPRSDFPITLFVSGKDVVYSDDGMKKFKKLGTVSAEKFYGLSTGDSASSFDLPDLDEDIYEAKEETAEKTKRGLLIPLWRIDVDVSSTGTLSVKEVLNLHSAETFAFEPYEEEPAEEGGGETGDPCEVGDGEGVTHGGEMGGSPGGGGEGGSIDEDGEGGEKPCNQD